MFSQIEMNIFIPRDPYLLTSEFRLQDMIDDNFDKLERMQYHVSFTAFLKLNKNIILIKPSFA
jgi:hypothetical protein